MELIIVKNGHVLARASDAAGEGDEYVLEKAETLPPYPDVEAGSGREWTLDYADGVLAWIAKTRPLTAKERLEEVEKRVTELEYPTWRQPEGAHDAYPIGARVTHNGIRYRSETAANVWEPGTGAAQALWTAEA